MRRIGAVALLLAPSLPARADAQVRYVVQVQHGSAPVTVFVNAMPVLESGDDSGTMIGVVSDFFRQGENEIQVVFGPGESAPAASVKLGRQEPGRSINWTSEWTGSASRHDTVRTPKMTATGEHEPAWEWEGAPVVESVNAADRRAILTEVERLHAAFDRGDADAAFSMLRPVFHEMGGRISSLTDRVRDRYETCLTADQWMLDPLPSDLDLTVYGRLVRVSAARPVISSAEVEGCGMIRLESLYLARLDGAWKIVRAR